MPYFFDALAGGGFFVGEAAVPSHFGSETPFVRRTSTMRCARSSQAFTALLQASTPAKLPSSTARSPLLFAKSRLVVAWQYLRRSSGTDSSLSSSIEAFG